MGEAVAVAVGLLVIALKIHSPADCSPEWAFGQEEVPLLPDVRVAWNMPLVGWMCRCCRMCEEADTTGYWMLVDWWACLDGQRMWSLDYKVRWEARAPSADFARDFISHSLCTEAPGCF